MPRRSWPHGAAASRTRGRPPAVWPVIDQRGRLLVAALGFAGLPRPSYDRALWALRFWLDSWRGIGDVERGMARPGLRSPAHAVTTEPTGKGLPFPVGNAAQSLRHHGAGAVTRRRDLEGAGHRVSSV